MKTKTKRSSRDWNQYLDGYQSLDGISRHFPQTHSVLPTIWSRLRNRLRVPCCLFCVAFIVGFLVYLSTYFIDAGNDYRKSLIRVQIKQGYIDITDPGLYSEVCPFVLFALSMALLSCTVTHLLCPEAASSGLLEMKTILSGTVKSVLLSKRLIVAKWCGLIAAMCAGLSAGKEGAFVHIAAAVADNIMQMPAFRDIFDQDIRRLEVLSHACAAGVSATMGSAFGGVLFALEFTSTSYVVRMLPEAFGTAVLCITILSLFGRAQSVIHVGHTPSTAAIAGTGTAPLDGAAKLAQLSAVNPLYPLNAPLFGYEYRAHSRRGILDTSPTEIAVCVTVGVLCGGLGICFVCVVDRLSGLRNHFLSATLHSPAQVLQRKYLLVFFATLVISLLQVWELVYGLHGREAPVYVFVSPFEANAHKEGDGLELDARDVSLLQFFGYKFFVTAISVTLPLPVGLFQPVFLCGGIAGRFIGEIIHCISHAAVARAGTGTAFAAVSSVDFLLPREFALVGAAAFSTGVTSAISTAAILFELSDSPHLCLPISLAVITARCLESFLYKNVYEALSVTGGFPYFPEMPPQLQHIPVSAIMQRVCRTDFLTKSATYEDIKAAVATARSDYVAIVECRRSMQLVAVVQKEQLECALNVLEWRCLEEEQDEESLAGLLGNLQLRTYESYGSLDVSENTISNHGLLRAEWNEHVHFSCVGSPTDIDACTGTGTEPGDMVVAVDPSPFSVLDTTALSKVDLCYRRLCLNIVYVCTSGRLVGFITRKQLNSMYTAAAAGLSSPCAGTSAAATSAELSTAEGKGEG